jgi:hypothetical protein
MSTNYTVVCQNLFEMSFLTGSMPHNTDISAIGSYIPTNIECQTNIKKQEDKYHTIFVVFLSIDICKQSLNKKKLLI